MFLGNFVNCTSNILDYEGTIHFSETDRLINEIRDYYFPLLNEDSPNKEMGAF